MLLLLFALAFVAVFSGDAVGERAADNSVAPAVAGSAKADKTDALLKDLRAAAEVVQEYKTKHPDWVFEFANLPYAMTLLHLDRVILLLRRYRASQQRNDLVVKSARIAKRASKVLQDGMILGGVRTGLFEYAYVSPADGSSQPYAVYVPSTYTPDHPYPLIIFLHGYASVIDKVNWLEMMLSEDLLRMAEKNGFIVVLPFGRSNTEFMGVGEDDVLWVLSRMRSQFWIDENRVFLFGVSMGGSGAWTIAAHHPDLFAGVVPMAGRANYYLWKGIDKKTFPGFKCLQMDMDYAWELAPNFRSLPVFAFHGKRDSLVDPRQTERMVARLKRLGFDAQMRMPDTTHQGIWSATFTNASLHAWLRRTKRNARPRTVEYATYTLRYNRAYWVEIVELERWGKRAYVRATCEGNATIKVESENVAALRLHLSQSPFANKEKVVVKTAGKTIVARGDRTVLVRLSTEKSSRATLKKTPTLCGPVREAYRGPFLFVFGTDDKGEAKKRCEQAAMDWMLFAAGTPEIKPDNQVTDYDIGHRNLVLFGSPESNSLLARIADKLPIRITSDCYEVAGKKFDATKFGLMMIYPNPLNPERYVLVCSGLHWGEKLPVNHKLDFVPDFIIYSADVDETGMNRYALAGYFDKHWQLSSSLMWSENTPSKKGGATEAPTTFGGYEEN